jgi:ABC-type amino acid transport system permease subunit
MASRKRHQATIGELMDIIERIRNLLLQPRREWPRIAAEDATTLSPTLFYVSVLASIGPAGLLFKSLGGSLFLAVFTYAFTLFEVYMLVQTVDILAPWFGGERNFPQSLKLIAYSLTAWWLADACQFAGLPPVAVLAIGLLTAAYCMYSFRLGAPALKRCSPEKATALTLLIAVCMTMLSVVLQSALLLILREVFGLGA